MTAPVAGQAGQVLADGANVAVGLVGSIIVLLLIVACIGLFFAMSRSLRKVGSGTHTVNRLPRPPEQRRPGRQGPARPGTANHPGTPRTGPPAPPAG